MKLAELSKEDQALVAMDFGADLEKQAAAEVTEAREMYSLGHDKLAAETADSLDKLASEMAEAEEEEKKHKKHKLEEEEEKKASAAAAFIERGFYDGLKKLGSERKGNENYYVDFFVNEKKASAQ